MAQDTETSHKLFYNLKNPNLLRKEAFLGGEWTRGKEKFSVQDPSLQHSILEVPDLGVIETKKAIEASGKGFSIWSGLQPKERSSALLKWYTLIKENREDLSQILTSENGKPLEEAAAEIDFGATFIEWFAHEALRVYGDVIPQNSKKHRILVLKQAVGPCALLTPWNFPVAMITRKASAALAAGCSVVIKPSSHTPLSALALAHLAVEAGIPPLVFQVITTQSHSSEVGEELCTNPTIKKISFTGSTEIGKLLMHHASSNVSRVSLELGGDAPFLVFDDADVSLAVKGLMEAKFRASGQTCVCPNRLYIHQKVYQEFKEKLLSEMKKLQVGSGHDAGVQIGPLIHEKGFKKVEGLVDDAVKKGAKVLLGGHRHRLGGTFYEPTLLENPSDSMEITHKEIFGPVVILSCFSSEEEVIKSANQSDFGLAAYFYSRDAARIWRMAEALQVGMIGINEGDIDAEAAPFGGIKQSGFGKEGSKYGIEDFLNVKALFWGGL